MLSKDQMIQLLKEDVVPALGCTEPVCVALCAANAAKLAEGKVNTIKIYVNANIYKNGMSAGIPNSTQVGLKAAAALGALLGNPEKGLQLLEDITEEIREKAEKLVSDNQVSVTIEPCENNLYVRCVISAEHGNSECIIRNSHTNVVFLKKKEEIVFQKEDKIQQQENKIIEELKSMTLAQIRELVDSMSEEDLLFMMDGAVMNEELASYSEEQPVGIGFSKLLRKQIGNNLLADDLMSRIMLQVASAAESRLDGCPYPTMSSSGAGTKGLVVILPIVETAKAIGASREKEVKAIAFGHLVNRYINAYIGKLSAMCTCVMASSTAAAAAMTWLMGGNDEEIGYAVRNMTGTVTGMICDGGKVGCAMKVSMASSAALVCAMSAVNDTVLRVSDGVCAKTPEECISNIARIGNPGMVETDQEILDIMLKKEEA